MTILCYHSVEPDWESPLAVTPEAFAAQATWLSRSRQVLPVRNALSPAGCSRDGCRGGRRR